MYPPIELLASHSPSSIAIWKACLSKTRATRMMKAGGGTMNAITWAMAHIAGHWLSRPRAAVENFDFQTGDPTPPTLADARAWLDRGRRVHGRVAPGR